MMFSSKFLTVGTFPMHAGIIPMLADLIPTLAGNNPARKNFHEFR